MRAKEIFNHILRTCILVAIGLAVGNLTTLAQVPQYAVYEIPTTLPVTPIDFNDTGDLVGYVEHASGNDQGFFLERWWLQGGRFYLLYGTNAMTGLNEYRMVGTADVLNGFGSANPHLFAWVIPRTGFMQPPVDLTQRMGHFETVSNGRWGRSAINDNDMVIGLNDPQQNSNQDMIAFTYDLSADTWQPIQIPPGGVRVHPLDIDNAGDVVGEIAMEYGQFHAFFNDGYWTYDLGSFWGFDASAAAISQNRDFVGDVCPWLYRREAFIWLDFMGSPMPIHPGFAENSSAYDLDDDPNLVSVVGYVQPTVPGGAYACLWQVDRNTGAYQDYDLNTLITPGSPWYLEKAMTINNYGEIAGVGYKNGVQRGFILYPIGYE